MTGRGRNRVPPRLPERLLALLLHPRDREPILGDLAEEHGSRAADDPAAADRWYAREMRRSLVPALSRRLRLGAGPPGRRPESSGPDGEGLVAALLHDLRYVARAILRSPGFTAAAVLTLALGIGANAAVFSAVHGALIRPLHFDDPDGLVAVWPTDHASRQLLDWMNEELTTLEGVSGYGGVLLTLREGGEPTEIFADEITVNHLGVLGVTPALGRGFVGEDGVPRGGSAVVLSHRLWMERFGGDPEVLGRSIALGGEGLARRTVVGVMPRDYEPLHGSGVDVWIPIVFDRSHQNYDGSYFVEAVGRLAPDVTLTEARAEFRRFMVTVQERIPGQVSEEEAARADLVPLADDLVGEHRIRLLVLFAGVGLVLLVAAANVANLLLARSAGRRRELAVRAALGAGRGRLARQALLESLTLGLLGAVGGLGLAHLARGLVLHWVPGRLPEDAVGIGPPVVLFTVALAGAAALGAGLVPALRAARRDPAEALAGARGVRDDRGAHRLQSLLVAGQLALATVLVTGAGLLGVTVWRLQEVELGFRPENVMTFRISAPVEAYPADEDILRYFGEVRRALAAVPGVEAAGFTSRLPLGGGTSRITIYPEGHEPAEGERVPESTHRLITPGFLEAVGATLVRGSSPEESSSVEGPLSAVANRALVERFWPGEDPIGKTFRGPGGVVWLQVGGVVEDLREDDLTGPVDPGLYIPHRDWPWRTMHAVVRTRAEPRTLMPRLKEAVWTVAPGVPVARERTLESVVDGQSEETRRLARLAWIFAGLALLLGAVGAYGVVAYTVRRRRPELGIRAALGAGRSRLLRGELLRSGRSVALGVVVGVAASVAGGRALGAFLFGVEANDPRVLAVVVATLAIVGLTAIWIPARRGASVDPAEALRTE